jgi:cytochrome c553
MTSPLRRVPVLAGLVMGLSALQAYSTSAQDVTQQVAACVACHPKSEVSATSINPIIWGQNEGYVYLQLRDFKDEARASPSDGPMRFLTQAMTDEQMREIAKYVSLQSWPKFQESATARSDPLYLRGAQLTAYGDCGACHFNNWQGYSANPRLRGQTPGYLTTTINEFRSGSRANSPGMSDLMRTYADDDVKAIVAYLSSVD